MTETVQKTFYEATLSDDIKNNHTVTKEEAISLFEFFKNSALFRWQNVNNDCEDRANAICILLDHWQIPNYKGWVFSGSFLKKSGGALANLWNYHVAASLPVLEEKEIVHYIIDPATLDSIATINFWANNISETGPNFYLVKSSNYYIFPPGKINRDNWFGRNSQNYKWTMQGLSGINGVSKTGKAQICFNKSKIRSTEERFRRLKSKGILNGW